MSTGSMLRPDEGFQYDPPPLSWRFKNWLSSRESENSRHLLIAVILGVALFAFEVFNFDTTRYALGDFLGDVSFLGLSWAGILALAFCSIDFAGLFRLFAPERLRAESKEVWYLTGAWLLGATMNAVMTWWAVSLTLLNNQFGNEVMGREQLLRIVPIFVAVLVWLTRILFIGSLSLASDKLLANRRNAEQRPVVARPQAAQAVATPRQRPVQATAKPAKAPIAKRQATIKERPAQVKPRVKPRPITDTNPTVVARQPKPVRGAVRPRPAAASRPVQKPLTGVQARPRR